MKTIMAIFGICILTLCGMVAMDAGGVEWSEAAWFSVAVALSVAASLVITALVSFHESKKLERSEQKRNRKLYYWCAKCGHTKILWTKDKDGLTPKCAKCGIGPVVSREAIRRLPYQSAYVQKTPAMPGR